MTTRKPLARFWKALDEIPDATTDRREWSLRLDDDWPVAAVYLTALGRLAKDIACPSPGGDGCPRKVVKHADGRFRAVCGTKPAECDPIDLTREDVTCLALDHAKLATAVAAILNAEPDARTPGNSAAMIVGSHGVAAGAGIPIILLIPGPMEVVSAAALNELIADAGPMGIVVPTARSIPRSLTVALAAQGHSVLPLAEITTVKDHRLVGILPAEKLLTTLREKLLEGDTSAVSGRAWLLPADARWQDLVFEFTAEEVVNVRFRSETRRFEPEQFGMKSRKDGKPTLAWILLRTMAENGGQLSWRDKDATDRVKSQKRQVAGGLRHAFGLGSDPLPWHRQAAAYQALFQLRDRRPVRGR